MIKRFFRFASKTPPAPAPPQRPPAPPGIAKSNPPKPAVGPPASAPAVEEKPSLVGQWKEPNGTDRTEFRSDGTVIEHPANGEPTRGRYSLEGDTLKVKLDATGDEYSFTVTITAKTLEMKFADGQVTKYERV